MHFPFCVKNDFMSVKKTASFKTRHLAVEFILLCGLRYARVTMPLLLAMKPCIRLCRPCLLLSDNEQLREGIKLTQIYPAVSCTVMVVCFLPKQYFCK